MRKILFIFFAVNIFVSIIFFQCEAENYDFGDSKCGIKFYEPGWHEIHEAVFQSDYQKIESLLKNGISVNEIAGNGYTPLHIAVERKDISMVKFLLNKGADVFLINRYNCSPLDIAVINDDPDITKIILEKGPYVNKIPPIIEVAILNGNDEIIQALKQKGAIYPFPEPNIEMFNPIIKAGSIQADIFLDNTDEVKKKVKKNRNIVNKGSGIVQTPLMLAALLGRTAISAYLIDNGATINYKTGRTPLSNAVYGKHYDEVKLLISRGADVNHIISNGTSILHLAVNRENKDIIELLIKNGANLNFRDKEGKTPLSYARQTGDKEIIKILEENGAIE